jgi:hypothetical protein
MKHNSVRISKNTEIFDDIKTVESIVKNLPTKGFQPKNEGSLQFSILSFTRDHKIR